MTVMAEQDVMISFAGETFDLREVLFCSTRQAEIETLAREKMPPLTLQEHDEHQIGVCQRVRRQHATSSRCWYQDPGLILFEF